MTNTSALEKELWMVLEWLSFSVALLLQEIPIFYALGKDDV